MPGACCRLRVQAMGFGCWRGSRRSFRIDACQADQEGKQRDWEESGRTKPGLFGKEQRGPVIRRPQRRLKNTPNCRQKKSLLQNLINRIAINFVLLYSV